MLDNKKLEQSSSIIKKLISDRMIIKPKENTMNFFIEKSRQSMNVASRLMELEEDEDLTADLWVINISYYAMFFAATSLLAKFGHMIKSETGIHKLTYHALVHYFLVEDNKLKQHYIEEYKEAINEAEELLQLSKEKIGDLISDFDNEMTKRKIFTYDLGKTTEKKKAETSLSRAKSFVKEIERVIR